MAIRNWTCALGLMLVIAAAPLAAKAEPLSAEDQVAAMGRGVNIIGYDPLWRDPAEARFQTRHMRVIRDGGFSTVRINLFAFRHMDESNRLSPQFLETLDTMVGAALTQGLQVILDEHDFNDCAEEVEVCRPRLMAFWSQISEHYKHAPEAVMFEVLNEPNRDLDAVWNEWFAEALAIIRATNPTRNVIVGPPQWNNIHRLDDLELPADDRHLIVTVHYYLPMPFTHQGARWAGDLQHVSGVEWGTEEERATLRSHFDAVAAWSAAHQRPILLGEFGAYDAGAIESRVAYTAAVAREAERHGWAWTYWQFDSDFIVYDIDEDRWNTPIHRALIPGAYE